jgi:hypothetical protein
MDQHQRSQQEESNRQEQAGAHQQQWQQQPYAMQPWSGQAAAYQQPMVHSTMMPQATGYGMGTYGAYQQPNIKMVCEQHVHHYVVATTKDGQTYEGIVAKVDDKHVHLAIPMAEEDCGCPSDESREEENDASGTSGSLENDERQWYPHGAHGWGWPYYHYGYPRPRPRRRFQPFILPLAALTALSVLPYYY